MGWAVLGKSIFAYLWDPGIKFITICGAKWPSRGCAGKNWWIKHDLNYYDNSKGQTKPEIELGTSQCATKYDKIICWAKLVVVLAILIMVRIGFVIFGSKSTFLVDVYSTTVKIKKSRVTLFLLLE